MSGLAPANLRLDQDRPDSAPDLDDILIDTADEASNLNADAQGNILKIEHPDGSITISLDNQSLTSASGGGDENPPGWFSNLVDKIDQDELGTITERLLRGISDDVQSRKEWVEQRAQGVKLLGLTVELPNVQGASDGAPVEGMSRVRHPLLLEACLRFQANARSELLPTDGPIKIRNDDNNANLDEDKLADALESDLNHYLTSTATEYYPDTDGMLFKLGFGGTAFKKVYFCPLRNRPVSESVDADNLIVNNNTTDLGNAKRVTHKVMMRPSTVKRLQILGVYRDISLGDPNEADPDSLKREEMAQQGLSVGAMNPEDRDREIYECYCELNVKGFEHKFKGRESGLEIPYRVTIDVTSRQILSIVRNYNEETEKLPVSRVTFVKYTFVSSGFGFYDVGLLHILGNTTNAITAAWREMLDNGMYANFPGFLMADTGARQNTNIFRVPPGGAALVKTGLARLSDSIMPMPYNTQQMAPLMALVQDMATTGMRIGGTSEQQVGEGRADAPVGTTLALIEQATKVLNSVHKRMHAAQAEEFRLLVQCFREHPESFWQQPGVSTIKWDEATFIQALNDCDLVPQADPNTASHVQRMAKIAALIQLSQTQPSLFNPVAVTTAALEAMGWSNPQQFLVPPDAMQKPPPELIEAQAKVANDGKKADAALMLAQAKVQEMQKGGLSAAQPDPTAQFDAETKRMDAVTKAKDVAQKVHLAQIEDANRDKDRHAEMAEAKLNFVQDLIHHQADAARDAEKEAAPVEKEVGI